MEEKEIFFLRLFISIYTPRNPETRTDLMRWRVSARNFLQLQKKFQKDLFSSFQVTVKFLPFCHTHSARSIQVFNWSQYSRRILAVLVDEQYAVPLSTSEEKIWEISYFNLSFVSLRKLRNLVLIRLRLRSNNQ